MNAQEIRQKYLEFFEAKGHKIIPRAQLVPQNDPTTLFISSGMQPLVPYLLGESHPEGTKLVNSQTCIRTPDIEDIGDGRHFTFFEMLGNWSLGDYFKREQLSWFFEFLVDAVGIDPTKLYVTCFIGDTSTGVYKDIESAEIWQKLFNAKNVEAKTSDMGSEENAYEKGMKPGQRIFYYDASKNWWSRDGLPADMAVGEPGGPDSEVFFDTGVKHKTEFGLNCHPNCDCGRFIEIGNSVFMAYVKTKSGFEKLQKPNVDFGGGLERIAAAALGTGDAYETSLFKPILENLEKLSGKKYADHTHSMRVIIDHVRASVFLGANDVKPSNKDRGYVLRRLLRRAIRYAFDLGIDHDFCSKVMPLVIDLYATDFPELKKQEKEIIKTFAAEEKLFRQTLRKGLNKFEKTAKDKKSLSGKDMFMLYDTFGFPVELTKEEAVKQKIELEVQADDDFEDLMEEQRKRSQTASAGTFKGGLADHSEQVIKYHTATHLMYQALKNVLGPDVIQRGSNTTAERIRFDFSHPEKVTPEQIAKVERIVNEKIEEDLPVSWLEMPTKEALTSASGAFGDKYGDVVKVYTIGRPEKPFSREICGGPHVEHTGVLGEGRKQFKIIKEEASSAGVRRIKAVLQ